MLAVGVDYCHSLLLLLLLSVLLFIRFNNVESNSNLLSNVITNVEHIAYFNFRSWCSRLPYFCCSRCC